MVENLEKEKTIFIYMETDHDNPLKGKIQRIDLTGNKDHIYRISPNKDYIEFNLLKNVLKEKNIVSFDAEKIIRFFYFHFGKDILNNNFEDIKTACRCIFFELEDFNLKKINEKLLGIYNDEEPVLAIKKLYKFLWESYNIDKNPIYKCQINILRTLSSIKGFEFDLDNALVILNQKQQSYQKLKNWIKKTYNINPNKNDEIIKFLKKAGFDINNTLETSLNRIDHELSKSILKYRKLKKEIDLLQNYIEYTDNKKIISVFLSWGAVSGRIISKEPNIQNVPNKREIKQLFISRKDKILIGADYPQIELRIAAAYTKDKTMIEAFKNNVDLHKLIASKITGKPINKISKEERNKGKAVNFGALFGMGAKTLKEYAFNIYKVDISLDEAFEIIKTYKKTFKGIDKWHKETAKALKQKKEIVVKTITGRPIIARNFTNALNYPIQGSGADLIKFSIVSFETLKKKYSLNCNIINVIHDEIIVETSIKDKEKAKNLLKLTMEKVFTKLIKDIPINIEVKEGKNWYEIKNG